MRKIIFICALLVSFNAYAAMWQLISQQYSPGTGWVCTYQLQGTSYTRTVIQQVSCSPYIYN